MLPYLHLTVFDTFPDAAAYTHTHYAAAYTQYAAAYNHYAAAYTQYAAAYMGRVRIMLSQAS